MNYNVGQNRTKMNVCVKVKHMSEKWGLELHIVFGKLQVKLVLLVHALQREDYWKS